jgi:hypothetical protein
MWCEWPSQAFTASAAETYFAGLLNFINSNGLTARIPRIILRVLHPQFPALEGGSAQFFSPSTSSLLFTSFLDKLPGGTELVLYPYVMESLAGTSWMSGYSSPVDGAAAFLKQWNDVLSSSGSSVRFVGMTIDLEEMPGLNSYSSFDVNSASVADLKSRHGDFEFGVAVGFDQTGKINSMVNFIDKFYIELYDFYTPTAGVNATPDSPFLLYQNQPQMMADFVLNKVLNAAQLTQYAQHSDKIMAMWSSQNIPGPCLYPLNDGRCGINNELGSWTGPNVNAFIQYIKSQSPAMAALDHGLFQYSFTNPSWV